MKKLSQFQQDMVARGYAGINPNGAFIMSTYVDAELIWNAGRESGIEDAAKVAQRDSKYYQATTDTPASIRELLKPNRSDSVVMAA
jgi:predicted Rdx family selenoprotein